MKGTTLACIVSDLSTPPHDGYRVLAQGAGFVVVDKACGLLSVPGIGPEKADCLWRAWRSAFPARASCTDSTATPAA